MCCPVEAANDEKSGIYWDDVKGGEIDPALARAARQEELQIFRQRRVYDVVPRSRVPPGKRVIGVRWVETDKGVAGSPKIRSRLVCQEFAFGNATAEMFAPTPPLSATRYVVSDLASRSKHGPGDHRLMLLDFKRAFLYGDVERQIFIELPEDDSRRMGGANVGLLRKAMYGTRDAPAVWQRLVRKVLLEQGFESSRTTACLYRHPERHLKVIAHVDDFLVSGPRRELHTLRKDLQEGYEVDGEILGDEAQSGKFLGRTLTWRPWGVDWEGDSKLVQGLLREWDLAGSKATDTPGTREERESSEELMGPKEAAAYRRGAAQLNYVAQDRLDMSFTAKDVASRMARPVQGDKLALERAIRYFRGFPRWVTHFVWQAQWNP